MGESEKTGTRPIFYLKIFGERNTGSTYLQQVCAANFLVTPLRGDVQEIWSLSFKLAEKLGNYFMVRQALHDMEIRRILHSDFGWKHAAPDLDVIGASEIAKFTRFVVLTKHPYSWLRSLHRSPYSFTEHDPVFSNFIREDFPVNFSDGLPGVTSCTPPALLRHKALAYRRLLESRHDVVHVRYEDLLQDFDATLAGLSARMYRTTKVFSNIDADVKGRKLGLGDFKLRYALEKTKAGMRPEDIAFCRAAIGEDVFELFGYEP